VILQLLGSLAVLALTAAPGRAYERQADKRAPRHAPRTSFAEYVDLVITGATTTFFAVLLVLLLAGLIDLVGPEAIDVGSLLGEPGQYVKDEPWRCVFFGLMATVLSFVIADQAGRRFGAKVEGDDDSTYGHHTIWWDSFTKLRPDGKGVSVSAELSGGLKLSGILRGFTPTESDDRELKVGRLVLQRGQSKPVKFPEDQFMLLRESQVNYLIAEYVADDKDQ